MANETVQSVRVEIRITGLVTDSTGDGARLVVLEEYDQTFSDGTGANQLGWVWHDSSRALNTTTETLDLDGLTDFRGQGMSDNNTVKIQYVRELGSTSGQKLTLGGGDWASSTGPLVDSSDKEVVQAGGVLLRIAPVNGFPITASTGDGWLIEASANQTYRVILAGDNT